MTLTDGIQIASTALAALAAGAAWVAARATRDSARQIRNGNLVEAHATRLEALRKIHTDVSWLGADSRNWAHRRLEILGRIQSSARSLPRCEELCGPTEQTKPDKDRIASAEAELRAAIAAENTFLTQLETEPISPRAISRLRAERDPRKRGSDHAHSSQS